MSHTQNEAIEQLNNEDSQAPYITRQIFQDEENGIFELIDIGSGNNVITYFEDGLIKSKIE